MWTAKPSGGPARVPPCRPRHRNIAATDTHSSGALECLNIQAGNRGRPYLGRRSHAASARLDGPACSVGPSAEFRSIPMQAKSDAGLPRVPDKGSRGQVRDRRAAREFQFPECTDLAGRVKRGVELFCSAPRRAGSRLSGGSGYAGTPWRSSRQGNFIGSLSHDFFDLLSQVVRLERLCEVSVGSRQP
jgi:hypothetical protein